MFSLLFGLACAAEPVTVPPPAVPEPPTVPLPEPPAPRLTDSVEVIPRAAWGARPAREGLLPHIIKRITVHHSATLAPDAASAPARIRSYQAYHQSKGFPDIAYHLVIDRDGNVYEGRSMEFAGSTFTNYDPAGHFLPLLDGNFEKQEPSEAQLTGLVRVLAWASQKWHIPPETIGAHRDFAATLCPGKTIFELVRTGKIALRVAELNATTDVSLMLLDEASGRSRLPAKAAPAEAAPAEAAPAEAAPAEAAPAEAAPAEAVHPAAP
ncbi:hypothetical protein LBMAG42_55680 [Deltaproteobacteria bacterium]|nr:hypothetical protein LBMAG42_55680 [Deltaproteobacteria bacterium]